MAATIVALALARGRALRISLLIEAILLCTIAALLVDRGTTPLPAADQLVGRADGPWLKALSVIWWLVAARLIANVAVLALGRDARSRKARLFSDLIAGAVYASAVFVVLNSVLDLPIRGVVATSGVIAIVLGLALQNTLSDLFSGIAVELDQPFRIGERLSVGEVEGIVVEVNWRSIRLQTDGADVVTIPNSIVAKSQLTNRSRPTEQRAATVELTVRTRAPATRIVEALRQATLLSPSVLPSPPAVILLKELLPRRTRLLIAFTVATSADLGRARSELLQQSRRMLRHSGIADDVPFDRADLIREVPLFETLSDTQVQSLGGAVIEHRLVAGATLVAPGSAVDAMYVASAGVLEMLLGEAAGGHILGRIGPGESFGMVSMMTGEPRRITVRTATNAVVLELPKAALEQLLKERPGFGQALEQSVKAGLALLDRDAAVRTGDLPTDERSFFRKLAAFVHMREPA